MKTEFSWGSCLFFALLLLTVPLNFLGAALTAAAFHELCHMAAILALGGRLRGLSVGAGGAKIRMDPMDPLKELLSAAAGPAGSFFLLTLSDRFPRLAVCGLLQGAFNLLPLYPMDGGRILRCFLLLILPENRAERLQKALSYLIIFLLATIVLLRAGAIGSLLVLSLIFPIILRKIPCKDLSFRVQ